MARAGQTASKSKGGQVPRRLFQSLEAGFHVFKDYVGNLVTTICSSIRPTEHVSKLSLHLYTLSLLKEPAHELCELFLQLNGIVRWSDARNHWPRVDVYITPLNSLEECMQYHLLEKDFRKSSGGPHIVPNWSRRGSYGSRTYRNVIFVIDKDCEDWQMVLKRGLLSVQYDLSTRPEDQFEVLQAKELDDPRNEGLVELNPVLDEPMIERVIIGREQEDEMRQEQQTNWANGSYLIKYPRTLHEVWSEMTMALCDCTYRRPSCDGCEEDFKHTDCAIEQDRHYLNDSGDCVACSDFKGTWPDDDDEGDLDGETAEEYAGALVIDWPREQSNSFHEAGVPPAS